ncbi:MAG TPA: flagellar hook capping FlgD N-terminal domain-containing protein [Bdellovibrionales bacterium]|nr:flagellar hook capping FlgD N-terminal domain-containing protein [Bdellovibrionales bacterium]
MVTNSTKTRAWSPAPQESSLKASKDQNLAAGKNPFGDKAIGDVLNEIADPNWVDPKKVIREPKQDLDKDAFFKLMLTQMKNQDPTNPLQSHEMAAQLAQFTSLEQLFNINEALGDLKKGQAPMADYQVLNFMGKQISADSSKVVRAPGDKAHELRFTLRGAAKTAEVSIKDAEGKLIKTYTVSDLKPGVNKVSWNGLDKDGQPSRAGDYHFTVEAKNEQGRKVAAETAISGRITGVNYTPKGPVLLIGEQTIYLQDVKKIEDQELKEAEKAKLVPQGQAPMAQNGSGPNGLPTAAQTAEAALNAAMAQTRGPGSTTGPSKPASPAPKASSTQANAAPASNEDVPGAPPETFGRGNLASIAMSSAVKDQVDKAQGLE